MLLRMYGVCNSVIYKVMACVPQKYDYVFDDKLNENCPFTKIVAKRTTETRSSTGVLVFPPDIFSAAIVPWETVVT